MEKDIDVEITEGSSNRGVRRGENIYEGPSEAMAVIVGSEVKSRVLLDQIKEGTPDSAELYNLRKGFNLPFPFCGSRPPADRFSLDRD